MTTRSQFKTVFAIACVAVAALALTATPVPAATEWSPAGISPVLWLDAGDASTMTSGGTVSQWLDKSGNGRHATQSTVANQPITSSRTVNGLNALDFNGSSHVMALPDGTIPAGDSNYSMFVVLEWDKDTPNQVVVGTMPNGNATGNWLGGIVTTPAAFGSWWQGYGLNLGQIAVGAEMWGAWYDNVAAGGTIYGNKNGSDSITSGTPGVDRNSLTTRQYVGANGFSSADYTDGAICEIVVLDNAISEPDRQDLEGYLAWKWGLEGNLPAGHPHESAAPSWTPADISTALWLDAADTSTIVTGEPVSQWNDKSGNGRHATQGSAANQPLSGNRTINGLNALDFNGSSHVMALPDGTIPAGDSNYSMFVVVEWDKNSPPQYVVGTMPSGAATGNFLGAIGPTRAVFGPWWSGYGHSLGPIAVGVEMWGAWYDNSVSTLYGNKNGSDSITSGVPAADRNSSTTRQFVGANGFSSSSYTDGAIGEVIVLAYDIAESDRQDLEGYLAWKWGLEGNLPAGHPHESGAPTWTPADISTALWLDAADTSTITSGTPVSQWADKSGNGNHATQGTAANQPVTGNRTVNGVNALDFNGSSHVMALPDGTIPAGDSNYSMFVVLEWDKNTPTQYVVGTMPDGAGTGNWLGGIVQTPAVFGPWWANYGVSLGPIAVDVEMWGAWYDNSVSTLYGNKNGDDTITSGVQAADRNSSTTRQFVGANGFNSSAYTDGAICEVVVLDYDISETERQELEGYLAWKWGLEGSLPAGHPYKNAAPTFSDGTLFIIR